MNERAEDLWVERSPLAVTAMFRRLSEDIGSGARNGLPNEVRTAGIAPILHLRRVTGMAQNEVVIH